MSKTQFNLSNVTCRNFHLSWGGGGGGGGGGGSVFMLSQGPGASETNDGYVEICLNKSTKSQYNHHNIKHSAVCIFWAVYVATTLDEMAMNNMHVFVLQI